MENLVKDGIINQELWDKARIKVLFILKEPYGRLTIENDVGKTEFNLCYWVENTSSFGRGGQTWTPIGRILKYLSVLDTEDDRRRIINSCAVVNCINTINDDATSNEQWHRTTPSKRLWSYYTDKRNDELLLQIEQINPDVIIFGGTYEVIRNKNHQLPEISQYTATKVELPNMPAFDNKVIVNFSHPSSKRIGDFRSVDYRDQYIAAEIIQKLL